MYKYALLLFLITNVNCLYVRNTHNIDTWPSNHQAEIITRPQSRNIFANKDLLAYQIPKENTVVVVPNSGNIVTGQIPVSRSIPYSYGMNTISRTPTTVIISQPAEYQRY